MKYGAEYKAKGQSFRKKIEIVQQQANYCVIIGMRKNEVNKKKNYINSNNVARYIRSLYNVQMQIV